MINFGRAYVSAKGTSTLHFVNQGGQIILVGGLDVAPWSLSLSLSHDNVMNQYHNLEFKEY